MHCEYLTDAIPMNTDKIHLNGEWIKRHFKKYVMSYIVGSLKNKKELEKWTASLHTLPSVNLTN